MFARAYRGRRREGFDYLEAEIAGRDPSFGYSVLAQILDETKHKIVVTTNFDNLAIDAISIYTKNTPLVCGHESLAGFIRQRPTRPQVVKVHRDLFYAPKNTAEELGPFPDAFAGALRELFKTSVPLVIGYGGNDGSLMGVLNGLAPGDLPQGIYWCYWREGLQPRQDILDLVGRHDGWLVPINGFDELMIRFQDALGLAPLDDFLQKRGDERADHYKERRDVLGQELTASSAVKVAPETRMTEEARERSAETVRSLQAVLGRAQSTRTPREWDSLAKLESDPTRRVQVYLEGLQALPRDAWMIEYTALALAREPAYRDKAEDLYKQAIALAPNDPAMLGNYANFLKSARRDYDMAESLYKRAVEASPKAAGNLGNYANFLRNVRHDDDAAEAFYKRAVEADPRLGVHLSNYANFVEHAKKDYDAAEALYKRALEADPKHPRTLGNYAHFLQTVRKDRVAAEAMFKRAVEADPKDANILANYARLLIDGSLVAEGIEMVDRAIACLSVDPLSPSATNAECWMYTYCCKLDEREVALRHLKQLVLAGVRTGDWEFGGVIAQALKLGHPDASRLPDLAAVLSGTASPESLNNWPSWQGIDNADAIVR